MKNIYFDHSATTPTDRQVLEEMEPYFSDIFGNASSIHDFGQNSFAGVEKARKRLADFLNCSVDEIIFTSGATEADNLAILGHIKAQKARKKEKLHIITSLIEHDAVLEPFMEAQRQGVEVDYIPVKKNGVIDTVKFEKMIRPETTLVSLMYVNSEVGSIQPVREVGKIIKKINEKRMRDWQKFGSAKKEPKPDLIYFHTDATQALNFLSCDTKKLHVDMLSLSAHKIYGPKGVGALFVKNKTPLSPIVLGGHQERGLRSGTINTTGIVGLGKAVELAGKNMDKNNKKIAKLRDMLVDGVREKVDKAILNTDRKNGTPSHAHFTFPGVEGEALLMALDMEGIAVSTGSACASGSLQASHVLIAMGIKKEIAHSSIRFTLGKNNTEVEIKKLIKVLPSLVEKFRKMNPIYK